jgi:hypothetical protein
MDQAELETLTTAILARLSGNARQPQGGGIGAGSGVLRNIDMNHVDPVKAREARKQYCAALSDAGLEKCSKAEKEIYFSECQQTLRDDGYFSA